MIEPKEHLLSELESLLSWKKSKAFYAEKLGISEEYLETLLNELKEKPIIETKSTQSKEVNADKGTLKSTIELDFEPKTDIELAALHKIDLSKYKISNYWSKLRTDGKFTSSILATLRQVDKDLSRQKNILLNELKVALNSKVSFNTKLNTANRKLAYEINIPDAHFGKLAWGEEVGEDYDLSIAKDRYKAAISQLLSYVKIDEIEKIIFPVGNDMINIDSRRNETYGGTPQDSDSRFFKIVRAVKEILIETINGLSLIAPVDVVVVSGNHDSETMFMIGEMLDAFYHKDKNVKVDNSPQQRKYYQYGANGFLYTHGNEEKHQELGLIFATEMPQLWADTKFRFCKLGHFHHNKKMQYLAINEFQGFQVQILPSLSGSDAWHKSKGYISNKQAKSFLYDKIKGQIGEFTYSI